MKDEEELEALQKSKENPESIGVVYEVDESLQIPSTEELDEIIDGLEADEKNHFPAKERLNIRQRKLLKTIKASNARFGIGFNNRIGAIKKGVFKPANTFLLLIDRSKFSLAPLLIIALVIFSFIRAAEAKSNLEVLTSNIESHLTVAFDQIESGDLAKALNEANEAKSDLGKLKHLMQAWGQDLVYLRYMPNNHSPLVACEQMLDSIFSILGTMDSVSSGLIEAHQNGSLTLTANSDGINALDLAKLHSTVGELLNRSLNDLVKSKDGLVSAQNNLPKSLKTDSAKAISVVDKTISAIKNSRELETGLFEWLTDRSDSSRDILVLFQNNTEMRGSGGFIGSYAIAHFETGALKSLDFQTNIYKLDKDFMSKTQIVPPEELSPLSGPAWALRDSNWAVNGPEAFSKVSEFYNLETGKQIDGIVALDTSLFIDLLKITGPIEVPEFSKTIGADNFLSDVQYEVEKGYFERPGGKAENEPKKILAVMMPKFINKISESFSDREKLPLVLGTLGKALSQKHLLFYVKDADLQRKLETNNIAGSIGHKVTDYLFVHNTNIGGMKSSLNVAESVKQTVTIEENGTVQNHLEILREHRGNGQWPDGNNKNLVRILIPQNSSVLDFNPAEGNFWPLADKNLAKPNLFKVSEEAGKSEVIFWQNTEPGQRSRSTLEYKSNYSVDTNAKEFSYKLYVQKQPGTLGDGFELEINYPKAYKPTNVKNYDFINQKILIKQFIDADKEFSINFEKQ